MGDDGKEPSDAPDPDARDRAVSAGGHASRSEAGTPCPRGQDGLRHAAAPVPAAGRHGSQCSDGPSSAANRGTSGLPRLRRRAWRRPSQLRPTVVRGRRVRRPASRRGSQRRGRRRHARRPRRAARRRRRPRRLPEPHAVRPRIRAARRRTRTRRSRAAARPRCRAPCRSRHRGVPSSSAPSISASASRYASSFASASFSTRDAECLRLRGDPTPLLPARGALGRRCDQPGRHRGHDARDGTRAGSGEGPAISPSTARRSRSYRPIERKPTPNRARRGGHAALRRAQGVAHSPPR